MRKAKQDKLSSIIFSLFTLSLIFFFNLLFIMNILKRLNIRYYSFTTGWQILIIYLIIFSINIVYFSFRKRYDRILSKYNKLTYNRQNRYFIISLFYVLASLLLASI